MNIPFPKKKLKWVVNSPTPKWDPFGFDPQPLHFSSRPSLTVAYVSRFRKPVFAPESPKPSRPPSTRKPRAVKVAPEKNPTDKFYATPFFLEGGCQARQKPMNTAKRVSLYGSDMWLLCVFFSFLFLRKSNYYYLLFACTHLECVLFEKRENPSEIVASPSSKKLPRR